MEARLRVASSADNAAALVVYAPIVRNTAISFEWEPPTLAEMEQRIAYTIETLPWLVCEAGGKVLHLVKHWLRQSGSEAYRPTLLIWGAEPHTPPSGSPSGKVRAERGPVRQPLGARGVVAAGVRVEG